MKILKTFLIAVVLLLALSIYGMWAAVEWLETDAGKQKLVEIIEAGAETSESGLEIGALQGSLFSSLTLSDVALKDQQGLWLKIDRLQLHWDPWALFSRKVLIQEIAFGTIDVMRKPLLPQSPPQTNRKKGGGQFPVIPVFVEINRLAAEQIHLQSPVIGEEVRASFESRMGYWGLSQGVALDLLLKRIDEIPGSVDFKMNFIPPTQTLIVDLKAYEPAGGILVRSLNVPDLPEMSATIHGDGTLEEWQGRFNMVAGNALGIEGQAEIKTVSETTYGLNLLMTSNVSSLVNPDLKDLLGDSQKLNARLTLIETDHLKIEEVEISIPAGRVALQGDLRFAEQSVNARYQLTAGDPQIFASLLPDVHWGSVTASGTLEGMQTHPRVELHVEAKSLVQGEFSVSRTVADFQVIPDRPFGEAGLAVAFNGKGAVHDPKGPDPVIQKISQQPLQWNLKGTLFSDTGRIALDQMETSLDGVRLNVNGQLEDWGQVAKVKGGVNLADISRFSEIAGRELRGAVALDWHAEVRDFGKVVQADFSSVMSNLDTGIPEARVLIGERLTLAGKIHRNAQGIMRVEEFTVKGAELSALVNATLNPDQTLLSEWSVAIPRLAKISSVIGQELSGDVTIRGTAKGPVQSPVIHAKIESQTLTLKEISIRQTTVQFKVRDVTQSPTGNVDAIAVINGHGASLFTGFTFKEGKLLLLDQTRLSALGAQVKGDLKVGLSPVAVNGTLNGSILDFADINALLDKKLSGDLALKVVLSEKEGQSARFNLQADNVKIEGESPLSVKSISLSGKAVDVLKTPMIDSKLQINDANIPGMTIQRTILNAKGTAEALDFDLATEFQPDGGPSANLKTSGNLKAESASQIVLLKTFTGSASKIPFQMVQPASLTLSGANIEMMGLVLKIEEGQVKGDFSKNQSGILATVQVDQLPLDLVNTFQPGLGLKGKLKGEIKLSALKVNPSGKLNFSVTGLTVAKAAEKSLPVSTASLQGNWNGKLATASFNLKQPSLGDFEASGEIPLIMQPETFAISLPPQTSLKGAAKGRIDLDILNDMVLTTGDQVKGIVDLAIQVGGVIDKPEIVGKIKLEGGLYESIKLGTTVDGIELLVSLDQNHIQIDKLYARTPKKGTISGSGNVTKSEQGELVANLNLKTQGAQLAATDTLTTQVTSDLNFTGPVNAAFLKGEIKIDRMEIYVPNNLPPSIVVLDVEETNGEKTEGNIKIESAPGKEEPGFDVGLDLKISAPGQIFVRGRGIDAQLEGNLAVTGSANAPKVDGVFKMRRGQMDLLGKQVKFKQGVVQLDGVPKRDPELDFKAEVPGKTATILVAVLGPVSNPKVQLSSSPEMPQDEILSRLLFDKSAGAMTPIEAVQLANSAAQLAGVGGQGPGFMDQVRGSLGLDTLKFSGGEGKSGPGLEAGRYLAEGVYVGVKQGLSDNSSSAVIEYEVTPNVSLESDIGADAQSRVGINMEWDY